MQIKIDFKIFVLAILFWLTHQLKIYVLIMIFALLHEVGHLFAGLLLKLKPKKMEINAFGLAITFEGIGENFSRSSNKKRIIIAMAGPIVNVLLIFFALFLPNNMNKELIIYANLILLIVNLLPVYPLDGGRILKNILHIKLGYWESIEHMNRISNVVTVCLTILASISILYFKNIAILLIIAYLWILVIKENRRYQMLKRTKAIIEKDRLILEKLSI